VAEHALVGDGIGRERVVAIVARTHRPDAAILRVPAQREFDQGAARGAMEVSAGMVPRSHDGIDSRFLGVDLFTGAVDAPAPLVARAIPLDHGIPGAGWPVIIRVAASPVLPRGTTGRGREGTRHPGEGVGFGDPGVADGALAAVDIRIVRGRGASVWAWSSQPAAASGSSQR